MKAIEFKSKLSKNRILIPKRIQIKEELESINKGLKDFEEGKTHSHDTARELYEKYL